MAVRKQFGPMRAEHMIPHITEKHLAEDGFLFMQPKIDGMRALFDQGIPRSRSWKEWTNVHLRQFAAEHAELIQGWDVEMLGGFLPDPTRFRQDMSGLRSAEGTNQFTFYLFDNWDPSWAIYPYEARFNACYGDIWNRQSHIGNPCAERWLCAPGEDLAKMSQAGHMIDIIGNTYHVKVVLCPTYIVRTMEEISQLEQKMLADGWEGAMLRRKGRGYKYGKSTELEGSLTKVKRFKDAEAIITGVNPRYRNENGPTRDQLGYQVRSAHQEGLVAEACVGSFDVRLATDETVTFNIGVFDGVSYEERCAWWGDKDNLLGKYVKFRHQDYGGYDVPRTPVFFAFRDPTEM